MTRDCICLTISASGCSADLVSIWKPLQDSTAEAATVPEALDDDIQEAVVLPHGVAQACSLLGRCSLSCRQPGRWVGRPWRWLLFICQACLHTHVIVQGLLENCEAAFWTRNAVAPYSQKACLRLTRFMRRVDSSRRHVSRCLCVQGSTCIAKAMASSSDKSSPCNAETAVLSHNATRYVACQIHSFKKCCRTHQFCILITALSRISEPNMSITMTRHQTSKAYRKCSGQLCKVQPIDSAGQQPCQVSSMSILRWVESIVQGRAPLHVTNACCKVLYTWGASSIIVDQVV